MRKCYHIKCVSGSAIYINCYLTNGLSFGRILRCNPVQYRERWFHKEYVRHYYALFYDAVLFPQVVCLVSDILILRHLVKLGYCLC